MKRPLSAGLGDLESQLADIKGGGRRRADFIGNVWVEGI